MHTLVVQAIHLSVLTGFNGVNLSCLCSVVSCEPWLQERSDRSDCIYFYCVLMTISLFKGMNQVLLDPSRRVEIAKMFDVGTYLPVAHNETKRIAYIIISTESSETINDP